MAKIRNVYPLIFCVSLVHSLSVLADDSQPALIRSVASGAWSAASSWDGGKVPAENSRVQIQTGHVVEYDISSSVPIRMIHVAGTLRFSPDRNTRLDVGLIKIQAGNDASENGFDCEAHLPEINEGVPRPALEVGTPDQPIAADCTALIRLIPCEGVDESSWPAIVCCGGRMDFHGAPLNRAWVKISETAKSGATTVKLAEPVTGWRVGDRVILTSTKERRSGEFQKEASQTEERLIQSLDATEIVLDAPLSHEHFAEGDFRGEIANLSRNVTVESAEPEKTRGHTMYHRGSKGSISYAEFRHLGKQNTLGRYSLHYHLVGDTMRGSSVVGASIWDSGNRWLTIHGTNHLIVRDCVGYRSIGHGFFLEDGTEVFNVLQRNLAVRATAGQPLKGQVLPYDRNDGAGFWWGNSRNTFTHNVACDNQEYGYRFDARTTDTFDSTLPVQNSDGVEIPVDIRTLPFVRFEDNECHSDGRYGVNLGEGANFTGSDEQHPFVVRNMKIWATHYAFRLQTPCVLLQTIRIHRCRYGMYFLDPIRHDYRDLMISETPDEPWSASHSDHSLQKGVLTVDGLIFEGIKSTYNQLIPLTHLNDGGTAESHFRNFQVVNWKGNERRAIVNMYNDDSLEPTSKGVPLYIHDFFGPGRHAKFASSLATDLLNDGNSYREILQVTGNRSRVAEVTNLTFPKPLSPIDDLPPTTVMTRFHHLPDGRLRVSGTASDNGEIRSVTVNGESCTPTEKNFVEWEIVLPATTRPNEILSSCATDMSGNVERVPHVVGPTL